MILVYINIILDNGNSESNKRRIQIEQHKREQTERIMGISTINRK